MAKRYLVVGSGGREHALAWKLASEGADVWVAPGNAGMAGDERLSGCVPIDALDFDALMDFAQKQRVDLTVVGPEAPLCAGIVDAFEARQLPIFGPTRYCAQLEGSKAFSKGLMAEAGVPTAAYQRFELLAEAAEFVTNQPHPLVIKADGLAAGKGVVVSPDVTTSLDTLQAFMAQGRHGSAGRTVIVENCLTGPEVSFMVVCDGRAAWPMATSRDHKRLLDGDRGPNTGGMGAITPSPDTSPELEAYVIETVIRPVLETLEARGHVYRGFLYAGLMLTPDGPKVLEFNCRLGDPETQALMVAMRGELGALLEAAAAGRGRATGRFESACAVVVAAAGYPDQPQRGAALHVSPTGAQIFYAGVARGEQGLVVDGGRVATVVACAHAPEDARNEAYAGVSAIHFEGMQVRGDIGR